jgi:TonB family protein
VPQSKPFRSGKILSAWDRDSSPETSSSQSGNVSGNLSGNLNESTALSSLKELIAAGGHRLDPILETIADAARQLTDASGAALAMWKDGAMVCRARAGDTAPALGAQLGAETGISGACLRTGKIQHCTDTENDPLVDVEVCRGLGLRSIVVLPIQGWRGINGVLEVFSTQPAAFTEQHIALLQQLAALAERARTSQPHGASSAAPKLPVEKSQPTGLLPASDRVGDVALAFLGARSRPFVLGAVGLIAISLLALVIWLGWRGPDGTDGKAHTATPSSVNTATVNTATAHPPDIDPVGKANPGGESLSLSIGKTSAGTPVKFASKVDAVAEIQVVRTPLLADAAADVAMPHELPGSEIAPQTGSHIDSRSDETASAEPPPIPAGSTNQSVLSGVLSAKVSLPGLSAPVSQGVSGGQLVHRVPPVYPAQARLQRLEGTVVLAATVMEDGTVRDVKVVEGPPVLAQSAVDAVKYWRYKPYELDGKPVKIETRITLNFKFPESLNH